jgi:hypothetical protein
VSGNVSHAGAGDSPPSSGYAQPSPYATLLAKIEEVEAYTHTVLQQYPKIERYALCADIRAALANIQRLSIVAWKRYHKKTTLQDLDVEIEVLRMWIRKSLCLQYITPRRYEIWVRHVNEIGRMVGGWLKAAR